MSKEACLRVERDGIDYRMGKEKLRFFPKTIKEAQGIIKQECMKYDTLQDVRIKGIRLEDWEQRDVDIMYKWTEGICEKQFKIWKETMK